MNVGLARQRPLQLLASLTALTVLSFACFATPGDLDPTFGTGGKLIDRAGVANGVVTQPNGKIVVVGRVKGNFSVARYDTDGSPDATFGDGGFVTTGFGSDESGATAVAIQTDGKIVAAGWKCECTDWGAEAFVLVRYDPDGSLDASFDEDGKVTTKIGLWPTAYAVVIQPDHKIIVGGFTWDRFNQYANDHFALARYNPDGSLDTTFDGDGKVTTKPCARGFCNDDLQAIAIQPDGKILAVGGGFDGSPNTQFEVVRYNVDGSLDTTFDFDGISITPIGAGGWATAVTSQASGKILAAGAFWNGSLRLVRLNANGSLDPTFDSDGIVTTPGLDAAYLAIQPNGKIVLAGTGYNGLDRDFKIVRYDPGGALDTTFSDDGATTVDFDNSNDSVWGMTLDNSGRAVVAGSSGARIAIARFLLESQFSISGRVISPSGQGLRNAAVSLTDQFGVARTTVTSSFGFYLFDNALAGASYTISATSRRYKFTPRTITISENLSSLDLVGFE